MQMLNLGILAHVDAGKTTLTERLLYAAGVIDEPGSVDDGSTQTDFLDLERRRGITIKSAVVSFAIGDVTVNLIDTPGHPDFIAEVERVLNVLDGAVLVVSAVEGVQAQTRVLMRTLQRLRIPTLIFVNKVDRGGAADERVLAAIAGKLDPAVIAMGSVSGLGTRAADFTPFTAADAGFAARLVELLAGHDDRLLAVYVDDETSVTSRRLRRELAAQTGRALVHPVFFGSAITGAGVAPLTRRHRRAAAGGRRRPRRPGLGRRLQDRPRPGGGEDRLCPPVLGDGAGAGPAAVRRRPGGQGHRDRRLRPRHGRAAPLDRRRPDRQALGAGRDPGRRPARRPADDRPRAPLRPADPGDGGRPRPAGRQGRPAHGPHPAGRAGPAHRPAPGRPAPGALGVALRGGPEGGHRGHAGQRLRPGGRLPRDHHHLHRTGHRHRRGRRAAAQATQPVPGHGRAPHRTGPCRLGRDVPDRGRAGLDAPGLLRRRRGHRAADPAPGPLWLGGDRLHRGHDPLRLPGQAQPRPPAVQQEHVQHRRGLPQPDPARADGRAA
ncbi:MAG: GTP-binding protein [Actinomycetes bacterium]